jgi:hypothetical protein
MAGVGCQVDTAAVAGEDDLLRRPQTTRSGSVARGAAPAAELASANSTIAVLTSTRATL